MYATKVLFLEEEEANSKKLTKDDFFYSDKIKLAHIKEFV